MAADIRRLVRHGPAANARDAGQDSAGGRDPGARAQVAGLDALETPLGVRDSWIHRAWSGTWPKALAIAIVLLGWQAVVMTGWRPTYVLPGPADVLARLWAEAQTITLWQAIAITMRRGLWAFALAILIGVSLGALVSRFGILRAAIGSLITGLQTMPSIAWFPLAILLFKLSEEAITFVVILGAAPSIANGLIHGIDHIPPVLTRAGRVMGARGIAAYRYVIVPAAMPSFVAGLKGGWAFAWRSLMAGELLVVIAYQASLGQLLQVNRELSDATGLLSIMLVILVIGILLDSLVFGQLERRIRAKRGLLPAESVRVRVVQGPV
jgi:NitT/TauT family transport system permease protein